MDFLAAALAMTLPLFAADSKPAASWKDLEAALPVVPKGQRQQEEYEATLQRLAARADLAPILLEKLSKLKPSTDRQAALLCNLILASVWHPDKRLAPALKRVAALKPRRGYDCAVNARLALRILDWEAELQTLAPPERLDRLTASAWDQEGDSLKRAAARELLKRFASKDWWPRLAASLPADCDSLDDAKFADRYPWIKRALKDGRRGPAVERFLDGCSASQDPLRQGLAASLRQNLTMSE